MDYSHEQSGWEKRRRLSPGPSAVTTGRDQELQPVLADVAHAVVGVAAGVASGTGRMTGCGKASLANMASLSSTP